MTGPNTPPINTTPGLLNEIRRFADAKSLGISAHVAESKSIVECVRREHGKDGVVEFLQQFGIASPQRDFCPLGSCIRGRNPHSQRNRRIGSRTIR